MLRLGCEFKLHATLFYTRGSYHLSEILLQMTSFMLHRRSLVASDIVWLNMAVTPSLLAHGGRQVPTSCFTALQVRLSAAILVQLSSATTCRTMSGRTRGTCHVALASSTEQKPDQSKTAHCPPPLSLNTPLSPIFLLPFHHQHPGLA